MESSSPSLRVTSTFLDRFFSGVKSSFVKSNLNALAASIEKDEVNSMSGKSTFILEHEKGNQEEQPVRNNYFESEPLSIRLATKNDDFGVQRQNTTIENKENRDRIYLDNSQDDEVHIDPGQEEHNEQTPNFSSISSRIPVLILEKEGGDKEKVHFEEDLIVHEF
jgi:hypothetical protein